MKVADTLHKNSAKLIESSISIKNLETGKLFTTGKGSFFCAMNMSSDSNCTVMITFSD
jgi:hypothetical protein